MKGHSLKHGQNISFMSVSSESSTPIVLNKKLREEESFNRKDE